MQSLVPSPTALGDYYVKECKKCKEVKPLTDFRKQRNTCYECEKEQNKAYHKEKASKVSKRKKEYWADNREVIKVAQRKRRYGISQEWYEDKLKQQDFRCAGCHTHQKDLEYSLCVDHCHTTEKPRGLLCKPCNLALGNADDNPDTLRRLAKYSEETRQA